MTEINAECSTEEEFEMVLEGLVKWKKVKINGNDIFRNTATNIISIPKPLYDYFISDKCYCYER